MNNDLTAIFLTVNRVPEHWRTFHREHLLKATEGYDLITVSRVPMPDMPGRNLIQDSEICADNVYRQMLRAAKLVTTPFIAVAEDDSLYCPEHFNEFRPRQNEFAYNMHRWSLYEWREPMYSWRDRISNLTLIAPTALAIKALEERFAMYPDGLPDHKVGELGKNRVSRKLGLPDHEVKMWNSTHAVLNVNHQYSMDDMEIRKVKRPGPVRAYEIPYWGHAKDILSHFR